MISRRHLLLTGGLALTGLATPTIIHRAAASTNPVIDIAINSDIQGSHVWFDPIGLWVEPGTTIRWNIVANVHTVTAYHPDNDQHSLRIPADAQPFDSGYLVNPGDRFEVTLNVPGTYDYFCAPHELGGMVGRIVVGAPSGPGSQPFDYFGQLSPRPDWQSVPEAARRNFPSEEKIMRDRIVRADQ